jgi:hypothetical protein
MTPTSGLAGSRRSLRSCEKFAPLPVKKSMYFGIHVPEASPALTAQCFSSGDSALLRRPPDQVPFRRLEELL